MDSHNLELDRNKGTFGFEYGTCFSVTKSCLILLKHPWTVVHQAPLSMGFPGKYSGVGCHFLLNGIFLTQGWKPCLLLDRQIFYHWASKEARAQHYLELHVMNIQWWPSSGSSWVKPLLPTRTIQRESWAEVVLWGWMCKGEELLSLPF